MQRIIAELKKIHNPLFCTQIGNEYYIWRLLTRKENKFIAGLGLSEMDMEDVVCSTCVLYPVVNWSVYKAGVAKALFPLIYDESGYRDPNQSRYLYEFYRQEIEDNKVHQAELMISTAFPEISIEEMSDWDAAKLWKKVAEAEYKLNLINKVYSIPGYSLSVTFNDEEKSSKKEMTEKMRAAGIDPMLTIDKSRWDKNYLKFPFIVGQRDFINGIEWENPTENEELFNAVQRQLLERKYRRKS